MKGQVVKVISEVFYVKVNDEVIPCKERGKLKKLKTLPLVGDFVLISKEKQVIEELLPRKNRLIRPNVANIDQAFIVTSFKNPDFSTNLLDKLLVQLEINKIKPIICLTKRDLITTSDYQENFEKIIKYYEKIGYTVLFNDDYLRIKKLLKNKLTVFTGQTGSGKSTLLNKLFPGLNLKIGEVSLALGRGKHTTRHTEIIEIKDIRVLDTPGFSALSFLSYQEEDLKAAFIEFKNFPCPYKDCNHDLESECEVKASVLKGEILESRYQNYLNFLQEFKQNKRW